MRRHAWRCRQGHGVPGRPHQLRARQRGDGALLQSALPGACRRRCGQPAARRAGRGRRDPGHRLSAAPGKRQATPPAAALGVAPALAARLAKLGLNSRFDLILHLPLRYEDETRVTPIAALVDGAFAQVEGVVESAEIQYRPRRTLLVRVGDGSGTLHLRFLNFYGSQVRALVAGKRLRVAGEARSGYFGAEMIHPRTREVAAGAPLPAALTPVYPTTAGVGQAVLRKAIVAAIAAARDDNALDDTAPAIPGHDLVPFAQAVEALHFPRPGDAVGRDPAAWRRMKFDELLAQQLSLKRAYRSRRSARAPAIAAPPADAADALEARLIAALPFGLTGAQARAFAQIGRDLAGAHPMRRLLQGDVGSGKTVVAALAACRAIDRGFQAAFMAPTEILAEQHHRKLSAWLAPLGVKIAWLAGGLKKRDKDASLAAVADGTAQLAIGTHALFQDRVRFQRLGLAIVDEQHRFGVDQRLMLSRKGAAAAEAPYLPHQLMMSATPIPRTLAMTYYADLDVSVIDELPPGRTPVATRLVAEARRDEVVLRIRAACQSGRQAYWVCPLIEESESLELKTAVETHARLSAALPDLAVALVHGRMKPAEKAKVMDDFSRGIAQVLVATTVIEVGVDVPNASLMVIEHAERFGLSQLHQLRGRVGRGTHESVCILLYQTPLSEAARARLKVIYGSSDGFAIAREDLRLRGPGEFLGRQQSGAPLLRFASLEEDLDLIEAASACADAMLAADDPRVARHLERWLGAREAYLGV
ncbi:MAG: ATP-dependent DNA helicase RecG [Burkholderiales bacterium]|nr:ATP-dependent DNA helicase RecG [Burkholderiales bacterium]